MNPATRRSLQQEYFALKKKYKKQVKLMHKEYKSDLIDEINALSSEHSQDVWRQIKKTPKIKYGRRKHPHISGSMDTSFSTITLW